jgi:two-component sensor histidine kinase
MLLGASLHQMSTVIQEREQGLLSAIEEKNKAQEIIRLALKEKELLINELQHRTKNNMQVIIAILKLKSSFCKDEQLQGIVKDLVVRIQVMALVQQKLSKTKTLTSISLNEYISDLVSLISRNYLTEKQQIVFSLNLEDITVLIDTATPCGMVLNELLLNSFKHAFPQGRSGVISLALKRLSNGKIAIVYEDNGVGIAAGKNIRKSDSLGLLTVFEIVEHQLKGQIHYQGQPGLKYTLEFPDNLYQERI